MPYLWLGARPVPKNEEGVREHSGWRFEYKGRDPKDSADLAWEEVRSGATRTNVFPEERKGRLDYELLCKLGVNRNAIINCDPLLFYQLVYYRWEILPRTNWKGTFNSKVENYTAKYAAGLGSYGHTFGPSKIQELLKFDMILVRDAIWSPWRK
jgi:hypothetical protein